MAVSQKGTQIIKMTAASDADTRVLKINFMYWYAPNAVAGNTLKVTDTAGNELWLSVADAANFIATWPIKNEITGIILDTIASGTLYIVLAPPFPDQY